MSTYEELVTGQKPWPKLAELTKGSFKRHGKCPGLWRKKGLGEITCECSDL